MKWYKIKCLIFGHKNVFQGPPPLNSPPGILLYDALYKCDRCGMWTGTFERYYK